MMSESTAISAVAAVAAVAAKTAETAPADSNTRPTKREWISQGCRYHRNNDLKIKVFLMVGKQ
jgi:hypothetical protein